MTEKLPANNRDNKAEPAAQPAYQPKRARSMVALVAVLMMLALFALIGIMIAVFSHKEDPEGIKIPVYTSRSLADEQPPVRVAPVKPPPPAPVSVLPPEPAQTESPVDFGTPVTSPAISPAKPKLLPEKKIAPQSMIIWDEKFLRPGRNTPPQIAIVIDDMGLNRVNSQRIVSMNSALTLAYLPYGEQLEKQTSLARAKGHELMVHMPMEPDDLKKNNPGPDALLTTNTAEENIRRLDRSLNRFEGYMGLNNHMGSQFTANGEAMRPVFQRIKDRGLWFLDSKTIGHSVAGKLAAEIGVPYVARDVFLDNVEDVAAVTRQLTMLEALARKRGYAVAIGHPHNATIAALQNWMPGAERRGMTFVSLSTIIAARFPGAQVPKYARLDPVPQIEPAGGMASVHLPESVWQKIN